MTPVLIRSTTEDDWREVRALRLEMLADTPHAYVETLQTALGHDEAEWRVRGRRGQAGTSTAQVAINGDGRWVGTMGGYDPGTGPVLVGVYVTPTLRGRRAGVADALLDAVETWAAGRGPTLRLLVHEDNTRAQAFYRRRGYALTGRSEPYVLDAGQRELEMARSLDR
ncbi:GNAT family N-acetyltransferase [Kineococcus sp. LSe6-4]|uniref:GNAT family N-acetyltransferase n=1 Tax=Kineococcus halophytocola TaxID=3234027 RepID=A0ABV4GVM9_9ACTN